MVTAPERGANSSGATCMLYTQYTPSASISDTLLTMPVYIIRAGTFSFYKVGTARDPQKRLQMLQVGCPFHLQLVAVIPGGRKEERRIHAALYEGRARGEWFDIAEPPTEEVILQWAATEPPEGFRFSRGSSADRAVLDRLALAGDDARASLAERNRLIIQARAEGATFQEIADAVQLTPMGVRKIAMKDDG